MLEARTANGTTMPALRGITYLAPSIPAELFAIIMGYLGRELGRRVEVECDARTSGPLRGGDHPFAAGGADIGWLCSPSYLWLGEVDPPAVELVPAAPVFRDPRGGGRPVYFADVIIRRGDPARDFAALRGRRWSYNDPCSLSGYFCLQQKLRALGTGPDFFRELRQSGSHLDSIRLVAAGEIDAAAIDSNVLALQLEARPGLREQLRVLESWGPFPIQPLVARAGLDGFKERAAAALLRAHADPEVRRHLAAHRVEGFAPIAPADFETERCALAAWERDAARGTA